MYKNGVREDPGSYRPLSLNSVPGRLVESITLSIERHLKINSVIRHSKHGFSKENSCLTNLIFFYKVISFVDEGKAVDVIFLDFREAFGTVLHSILLDKVVQLWEVQIHSALGDELTEGQTSKGGSEQGYI